MLLLWEGIRKIKLTLAINKYKPHKKLKFENQTFTFFCCNFHIDIMQPAKQNNKTR